MSYYPGQGYHGGQQGGYGAPPPNNGYGGYPPQQPQYGGYPPQQAPPSPQPPYGYGTPPPQQYGGYQQTPPPQQGYYNQPPPQQGYRPPPQQGGYGAPPPQQGHPNAYQNAYNQGQHGAPPPPPQQAQAFGHGAPGNYTFQYSNCTGKRKALLIGINYFGQRGQLRGCINDVKNMSGYLNQHFGYKREDMVLLTDDQQNPMSQPTKANILRAMHWLIKDAQPNDSLFFHYSGHGGQTKDLDGDEEDGYDEVIYPVDFRTAGHIVDDEMHRIMVGTLKPGVRLTAIFDSCHSGSALDLPYIYSTQGLLKEPNLAKEAGQGLLGIVSSYARGDIGGMASTALGLFKKAVSGDDVYQKNLRTKTSPADVIMWSGSKDSQTSYVDPFLFSHVPIPSLFPESACLFGQQEGKLSADLLPVSTVNMGLGGTGVPMPMMAPLGMPTIKEELDSAIGPSPMLATYPLPWLPRNDPSLAIPVSSVVPLHMP